VSEGSIFDAGPGTIFAHRTIANQFHASDTGALSVLAYAITHLGVRRIIVTGHYGCGGVAAAIASPPADAVDAADSAVQAWIDPIREIYQTSARCVLA
jgi:carbonic anhydrase